MVVVVVLVVVDVVDVVDVVVISSGTGSASGEATSWRTWSQGARFVFFRLL